MEREEEKMENMSEDSVYSRGPGEIEPEVIEPEVIEPEVIEPEVIEPEIKAENSNMYQYQTPQYSRVDNSAGNPKNKKNKMLIIGIVAAVMVIFCTFAGAVVMMNHLIQKAGGNDVNIDIGNNQNEGPIAMVETVSGSAVAEINDYSKLVEDVMPSIVAITQDYTQTYSVWGQTYGKQMQGNGSGFIISQEKDELLIVTNNHVVEGADKITVAFCDEETAEATVKGTDSITDLAVISIKMSKLKKSTKDAIRIAQLGSSDELKVGQSAIAIGNALGYGQSVTVGYISAKDREVTFQNSDRTENTMRLLQTDAAINPGNSGGALLDVDGKVVGINSGKYSSEEVEGMGYAIPISKAIPIINELVKRKVLNEEEKGYLGIAGKDITKDVSDSYGIPIGVYVSEVGKGSAAEAAGIKVGDVILSINGREVKSVREVQEIVTGYAVGTEIKILIKRSDNGEYKSQDVKAKLKDSSTLEKLETVPEGSESKEQVLPEEESEGMFPFPEGDY